MRFGFSVTAEKINTTQQRLAYKYKTDQQSTVTKLKNNEWHARYSWWQAQENTLEMCDDNCNWAGHNATTRMHGSQAKNNSRCHTTTD